MVAVAAAIWALVLSGSHALPYPESIGGLVPGWSAPWMSGSPAAPYAGLAVMLLTTFLLVNINNTYNLLRNITRLQATAFIILQMSAPALVVTLCQPSVSVLVVLVCLYLMFSTYSDAGAMSTVFLVFFILSACAGFDVMFIGLIPVFILGCAQMRVFSLRSVLALLMGLATPWIILFGFGIVNPESLTLPGLAVHVEDSAGRLLLPLILSASLSAFVLVSAWLQNLIKYLTYNAHSRAMLSMVTVLSLVSIIFAAIGFSNLYSCLPLLNMLSLIHI